ncbi:MAG: YfcE family phosphodiesterase [Gemmatimonadetes bacterium]|nr:YfcE family phosphodiesterase [Gemmatimonadota bacterium]
MLVGLLSDTHDRLPAIRALLQYMQERGVGIVLHAGDYCAPFSLKPFIELNMPMVGVFGRNDGDREGIRAYAQQGMGIELFESPHSFELGGQRMLLVHDLVDASPRSLESHGVVVHGFSHREEMMIRGETLIVNPGEGCGWLHGEPGGAILDTDTKDVHFFKLKDVHRLEASTEP